MFGLSGGTLFIAIMVLGACCYLLYQQVTMSFKPTEDEELEDDEVPVDARDYQSAMYAASEALFYVGSKGVPVSARQISNKRLGGLYKWAVKVEE